jgi:hypothetical protein
LDQVIRMNNPQKVYQFLIENPERFFCDDCLGARATVDRYEVNTIARTLSLFPSRFRRMSTACSECRREKESTEAMLSDSK